MAQQFLSFFIRFGSRDDRYIEPLDLSILSKLISGKMICSRNPQGVSFPDRQGFSRNTPEVAHRGRATLTSLSKNSYNPAPAQGDHDPDGHPLRGA